MRKMILIPVTLIIGLLIGVMAGPSLKRAGPTRDPMVVSNAGPTLEAVRSLASLVTTRVTVSDVQLTELQGYTGGAKAALLVRGDFTIGTDLSQARFSDTDSAAKSAVLVLPCPVPSSPRVDLNRTKMIALGAEGLWNVVPGRAADEAVATDAYSAAQKEIARLSHEPQWLDQAKHQAESVVKSFFESIGWHVSVRWEGDVSPAILREER